MPSKSLQISCDHLCQERRSYNVVINKSSQTNLNVVCPKSVLALSELLGTLYRLEYHGRVPIPKVIIKIELIVSAFNHSLITN